MVAEKGELHAEFLLKISSSQWVSILQMKFLVSKEVTCWAVAILEITDDVKMW